MAHTVYIVGAGASTEVGLPAGEALTEEIRKLLLIKYGGGQSRPISGSNLIAQALQVHARENGAGLGFNDFRAAACAVSDGMPLAESIDQYLHSHRGDRVKELCGKLAIVEAILAAEKHSHLYVDPHRPEDRMRAAGTWFSRFWHRYSEGCSAGDLAQRSREVAFVVFNYDRCIEHFLFHAARTYYQLKDEQARLAVGPVRVYHPYGVVGRLPWMETQESPADFGGDTTAHEILALSAQIKTFTEGADPASSQITAIRQELAEARRVVFLGFAFHRQNLELLWPAAATKVRGSGPRIYGTAFGVSDSDVELVTNTLADLTGTFDIQISLGANLKCARLFHEYKASLSLREPG